MIQKANPVTLTLYSSLPKGETTHYILRVARAPSKCVRCAPKGDTTTLGAKSPVKLKNPPAARPVHPKNLSLHNLSTQPAAKPRPFFIICGEAATTTLGLKGRQT